MNATRRYALATVAPFAAAATHALWTWPLRSAAALFLGGAAVAFALEALAVRAGLLRHALAPRVAGVPLAILLAWPTVVYVWYRIATLAVPAGVGAAALAAVLATLGDALLDPVGVRAGVWSYPEHPLSSPRYRGVPWWNFAGWLLVVFVTATLPSLVP